MLASKDINDLITIVAALRNRDSGCIWNLKQTFESLIPYLLEEVYEVIDAIERENRTDLCEELGDLLLQVIYHTTIAQEQGYFTFEDVIYAITAKMIRRHPHIFGNAEQKKRGFRVEGWEHIKKKERVKQKKICKEISVSDDSRTSILTKVKKSSPQIKRLSLYKKQQLKWDLIGMRIIKFLQKSKKNLMSLKKQLKSIKQLR